MYSIYMYCTFTFILALDVYACTLYMYVGNGWEYSECKSLRGALCPTGDGGG